MRANHRDIAEFARLGLRFHLLAASAITAWAEGVVAEVDVPEPWLIDLALAVTPEAIEDALGRVPGDPQADLAIRFFLALVLRRWRSGSLTIGDVRGIGWELHRDSALPTPDGQADWGVCLEVEGEELGQGWRTEGELRASIDEKLAEYSDLEAAIPAWA